MGVSILSLVEIFYYITLRLGCILTTRKVGKISSLENVELTELKVDDKTE
jgi:hypothetical protein